MSEISDASQFQNEQDDELPIEGQPAGPSPKGSTEESTENQEPEIPDWLLELESKPVVVPFETIAQESYPDRGRPGQETTRDKTAAEPLEDDLPDWLKVDGKAPVRAEQKAASEDEIPDWLRRGMEDLQPAETGAETLEEPAHPATDSELPGGITLPPVFAQTADTEEWPKPPGRKPVGSHPLPNWLVDPDQPEESPVREEQTTQPGHPDTEELPEQDISTTAPAALDLETLADVRQMLKEDELSEPPQKRSGLLERMAGPIIASRLIRPDRSDQDEETGGAETLPAGPGEEAADYPEFPDELLSEAASSLPEEFDIGDELIEEDDFATLFDESGVNYVEEAEASDQELRAEARSATETSGSDLALPPAEKGKEKKPSFRSRLGFKKADELEEPAISDEQLERRLLVALSAANLDEPLATESEEAAVAIESTTVPIQEEEVDFRYLTDYAEEEEASFDFAPEEEEKGSVYLDETADEWPEASQLADLDQSELIEEFEEDEFSEAGRSEIDLREVALKDYVEPPQEPEGGPVDVFIHKVIGKFNRFSLTQKLALAALALMNVGLVMALGILLILSLLPSQAAAPSVPSTPTRPLVSGPYPSEVILPGGWSFKLKTGALQNGAWFNQGAEWLQGTEITRWVALPWSKQLEAVAVTFQPTDQIELVMSNQDHVKYQVESVVSVPLEKVVELNRNSPSLLLILANQDTTTRVVVIGTLIADEETK